MPVRLFLEANNVVLAPLSGCKYLTWSQIRVCTIKVSQSKILSLNIFRFDLSLNSRVGLDFYSQLTFIVLTASHNVSLLSFTCGPLFAPKYVKTQLNFCSFYY